LNKVMRGGTGKALKNSFRGPAALKGGDNHFRKPGGGKIGKAPLHNPHQRSKRRIGLKREGHPLHESTTAKSRRRLKRTDQWGAGNRHEAYTTEKVRVQSGGFRSQSNLQQGAVGSMAKRKTSRKTKKKRHKGGGWGWDRRETTKE